MVNMTKAQYFTLPKAMRKRQKDMTHWVLIRAGSKAEWRQVKWTS